MHEDIRPLFLPIRAMEASATPVWDKVDNEKYQINKWRPNIVERTCTFVSYSVWVISNLLECNVNLPENDDRQTIWIENAFASINQLKCAYNKYNGWIKIQSYERAHEWIINKKCVCLCSQHFHTKFPLELLLFFYGAAYFNRNRVYALEMIWTFPLQTENFHLTVPWCSEQFPLKITMEILWLVVVFYMSTNVSVCHRYIYFILFGYNRYHLMKFPFKTATKFNHILFLALSIQFIMRQSNLTPLY